MKRGVGLDRLAAAAWASRRTGYRISHSVVSYWERRRLLRPQNPGRRIPACYTVPDLIRLEVVSTLRRDGASLQRVGRALRELRRLLPRLVDRASTWRLAVDSRGHVVRFEDGERLLELTASAGQLAVFNVADIAREARAAIAWAATA
jgi:DNA-binding transcriptional MerR regulator